MPLTFEWDSRKSRSNLAKHGVRFDEASTIFSDPLSLTIPDPEHSVEENRYITMGRAFNGKMFVVVHTDRGDNIRIISARRERQRMKKSTKPTRNGVREEYDFSQGERGKYAGRSAHGTNVVVLEPDVARKFPTSKSVNASLRKLIRRETATAPN